MPQPALPASERMPTPGGYVDSPQQYDRRPAGKSPVLYAVLGVVATLVIVTGLGLAYLMGQSGKEVAGTAPQFLQPAQPTGGAAPNLPSGTANTPPLPPVTTDNQPTSPPPNQGTDTTPQQQPSSPQAPPPSPSPGLPTTTPPEGSKDDPNRPSNQPNPLTQPVGATPPGTSDGSRVKPLIIEVPVPVILPSKKKTPQAKPDLVVNIRNIKDEDGRILFVDHMSNPGLSAELDISLDRTPKADVEFKITPIEGLKVDPSEITWAANVSPATNRVTITGDGKADLSAGPAKMFKLKAEVSGGRLSAPGALEIPVQILRRNSYQNLATAVTFVRGDVTALSGGNSNSGTWTRQPPPPSPATTVPGVDYTLEYVELLLANGTRLRLFKDKILAQSAPNSPTYLPAGSGTWR